MTLPTDPKARKAAPLARGCIDYFPDALVEVAKLSLRANEQHNPGEELHWAREKSTDHADCIARHLIDRGKIDTDGERHSAKVAWRALALLQLEIEREEEMTAAAVMTAQNTEADECQCPECRIRRFNAALAFGRKPE